MRVARWTIFDTNVYVTALREGLGGASYARLQEAAPRTFWASVVSAELRAGAVDAAGRTVVADLSKHFERLGRVVAPTSTSWNAVGDVLATIVRRDPSLRAKVRTLWNDALIALSARQIGATVVTENMDDFRLLRRYVRFDVEQAPSGLS
jgi:predicted nucleic acid-binding protein